MNIVILFSRHGANIKYILIQCAVNPDVAEVDDYVKGKNR